MAGLAQAEIEAGHGLVFAAGTPKDGYYGQGDIVWIKGEQTAPKQDEKKRYRIRNQALRTADFAGTEKRIIKDGTAAVLATVQAATQPTSVAVPYWYDLVNTNTGEVVEGVHESDLMNAAAIQAYVGTQLAALYV